MNKEKILILFNGEHLAYSPTTIQLYDELDKYYDVTIVAQTPRSFNQKLNSRNIIYHQIYNVRLRYFYLILFQLLSFFNSEVKYFKKHKINYKQYFFRYRFIKKILQKNSYKAILSIDTINALMCSLLKVKFTFVSLELCADEHLFALVDLQHVDSVIIQSKLRYEYLFKNETIKTFYIQNSPTYNPIKLGIKRIGLIYGGTANNEFGFYHCLNFLKEYEEETLTVQGAVLSLDKNRIEKEYSNLIHSKRLIISNVYLDNNDVVGFLSKYEIGFCFYNFDTPAIKDNYFNYFTAPSGKIFKYLSAGVPVIAINIVGFKFVNEFKCGILIDELNPKAIKNAVDEIRKDYSFYVNNSINAAKFFSFDKSVLPFLEFIAEK